MKREGTRFDSLDYNEQTAIENHCNLGRSYKRQIHVRHSRFGGNIENHQTEGVRRKPHVNKTVNYKFMMRSNVGPANDMT